HLLRRLAHGQAGGRLGDGGGVGGEVLQPDFSELTELPADALLFARADQGLGEILREEDRDVGQRLRAAGDDGVGVAAEDQVRRRGDGLIRRRARLADGVAGDLARQAGAEDDLARDVRRFDRGDDVAEDDFLHRLWIDAGARHQLADGELAEVEGAQARVMRAGFGEGGADAANDGDARGVLPHNGWSLPRSTGFSLSYASPTCTAPAAARARSRR